jgi:hypothetical protein
MVRREPEQRWNNLKPKGNREWLLEATFGASDTNRNINKDVLQDGRLLTSQLHRKLAL